MLPEIYNGRNRTFFFFNTEIVRFVQGITFTAVLPDPQMLTGDFSQAASRGRPPRDHLRSGHDGANPSGTGFIRDPFPGNVIPVESHRSGRPIRRAPVPATHQSQVAPLGRSTTHAPTATAWRRIP